MSKVGGALPAWYWPAGIPRRVPVPQQVIDRQLRQRLPRVKDRPAFIDGVTQLTYGDLLDRALKVAGGLQTAKPAGAIAIADTNPLEAAILMLGAMFAGVPVLLLDAASLDEAIAAQLREAKVTAIVGDDAARFGDTIPILSTQELSGTFREAPRRATESAVLLPSRRGAVLHSHFSLSAMGASLASFIPKLREATFICTQRALGSWETLAGIFNALLQGAPVVFAPLTSAQSDAPPAQVQNGYLILDREEADALVASGRLPAVVASASLVFVSTGYFTARWRRRLESLCGRPVFPIWGVPEIGPVIAPHPTWLPPHGHGFPLVNVTLLPIDPDSGKVSIVPWEMLDRAEVGVEALSAMVGYAETARNAGIRVGTVMRTRQLASMDHVGVVVLHDHAQEAAA
jgi:AMP-binding enzyme